VLKASCYQWSKLPHPFPMVVTFQYLKIKADDLGSYEKGLNLLSNDGKHVKFIISI